MRPDFAADNANGRVVRSKCGPSEVALRQRIAVCGSGSIAPARFYSTQRCRLLFSSAWSSSPCWSANNRRGGLLIARVALLASLAMIPLVALVPLPRLDLLDTLVQTDILPNSLILELETGGSPEAGSIVAEHEANSPFPHNLHDRILGAGRWLPRSLTLIDLACVGTGIAWLMLGFWGVRWLIRHSQPPSAAAAEIFDRLLADGVQRPTRARYCV